MEIQTIIERSLQGLTITTNSFFCFPGEENQEDVSQSVATRPRRCAYQARGDHAYQIKFVAVSVSVRPQKLQQTRRSRRGKSRLFGLLEATLHGLLGERSTSSASVSHENFIPD